jgi:hypothetical protein
VVELLDARERCSRRDAVDEDEAFAVSYPLVPQRCVLLLSGRVQDFEHARLLVDHDLLAVGVLDGRVVGLDEVVQAKLV